MKVAVLGAGLQGSCVALELAKRGVEVDLFDRNPLPMSEASLMNEGKLHLGYYYGNDASLRTARLVIRGALSLAPLLRRWLGAGVDSIPRSRPYVFAVHRDSLLSVEQIRAHFETCHQIGRESDGDYFDESLVAPIQQIDVAGFFDAQLVVAAFQTPEIAISAEALAILIRETLASEPGISLRMGSIVQTASPAETYCDVKAQTPDGPVSERYDHVVNALWSGRLALDAELGLIPQRPWLFRTKYDVRLPNTPIDDVVPPTSFVLGPFGDVVCYSNGETYLSWYPAALKDISRDIAPAPAQAVLDGEERRRIRDGTLSGLTQLVPRLAGLSAAAVSEAEVRGGVIFAWGETDIDDPDSDLHARFDVGPRSYGRYHSIDTGKLTTAPLFAKEFCDSLLG